MFLSHSNLWTQHFVTFLDLIVSLKCSLKYLHATQLSSHCGPDNIENENASLEIRILKPVPWIHFCCIHRSCGLVITPAQSLSPPLNRKISLKMFGNVASYNLYLSRVGDLSSPLSSPSSLSPWSWRDSFAQLTPTENDHLQQILSI